MKRSNRYIVDKYMKKQDYIKQQATIYKSLCDKRDKLARRCIEEDMTPKKRQSIIAELDFLGMNIGQTEERLMFALGAITPEQCRSRWKVSAFHVYDGIRGELENLNFD